jgi:hypothetical protein
LSANLGPMCWKCKSRNVECMEDGGMVYYD